MREQRGVVRIGCRSALLALLVIVFAGHHPVGAGARDGLPLADGPTAPDLVAQATQKAPAAKPGTTSGNTGNTRLAADLHLNQGMTYAAMRDWENAITEFSKAVDIDKGYAAAYTNRAVAYMQQRKYNKALDDLKQAESLNPSDKVLYYNYVALYSLQNQLDRALDSLDRALDLGFNNYDALRNDPDLNNVRVNPEFQRVLEKHKVFLR